MAKNMKKLARIDRIKASSDADVAQQAREGLDAGLEIMELTIKLVEQYHKNPVRDWLDKPLPALKKLAKLYVKLGFVEKPPRQVKL